MKQTLGKILLIVLFSINLFANVTASLNTNAIYKGDSVTLTLTAEGENIEFPQIDEIEGFPVIGTSSSQSMTVINGKVSKTISKSYSFAPFKSLTISPFEVKVDGKTYKSNSVKLSVVKPSASKSGDEFILKLKVDKSEAYVGEGVNVTLEFKQRLNAKADKVQIEDLKLQNFWIKKADKVEQDSEGEYNIQRVKYLLFPQKAGDYKIPSLTAQVGNIVRRNFGGFFNDPFFNNPFGGNDIKWQKVFSNEATLKVNPLPDSLELYGNFDIKTNVDKNQVKANKPVNLTISIMGEGNLDDIKKFSVDIDSAITYSDEPKIETKLVNGKYIGSFEQKLSIIADKNYTIPSISLKYFDKNKKEVLTKKTSPINIEVLGSPKSSSSEPKVEMSQELKESAPIVKEKKVIVKEASYIKYIYLAIGLILGFILALLIKRVKFKKEPKEIDIIKDIKRAKNDKALFEVLLPYTKDDILISQTLLKLEENIYSNAKHSIDKKALVEYFEEKEEEKEE